MAQTQSTCSHVKEIRDVKPSGKGCKECLAMGDTWVHLRECLICGHVGCCDSSKNKHATKHFHQTKHPIMQSFEPAQIWGWCMVEAIYLVSMAAGTADPRVGDFENPNSDLQAKLQ